MLIIDMSSSFYSDYFVSCCLSEFYLITRYNELYFYSILLDKNFRDELERRYAEDKRSMPDGGISYPSSNRYVSLMKQKHVQVFLFIMPFGIPFCIL